MNKAVYTATLVADGWAGAENLKKGLCNGRTDALKAMDCARWLIGSKSFISAIWLKLSRMVIVAF